MTDVRNYSVAVNSC